MSSRTPYDPVLDQHISGEAPAKTHVYEVFAGQRIPGDASPTDPYAPSFPVTAFSEYDPWAAQTTNSRVNAHLRQARRSERHTESRHARTSKLDEAAIGHGWIRPSMFLRFWRETARIVQEQEPDTDGVEALIERTKQASTRPQTQPDRYEPILSVWKRTPSALKTPVVRLDTDGDVIFDPDGIDRAGALRFYEEQVNATVLMPVYVHAEHSTSPSTLGGNLL